MGFQGLDPRQDRIEEFSEGIKFRLRHGGYVWKPQFQCRSDRDNARGGFSKNKRETSRTLRRYPTAGRDLNL